MKFQIHNIQRIDSPSGRLYKTPEGFLYPSITTVLSKTKDDNFLKEWKEKIGEENANRITQIAANRGTNLHKLCEDYLLGNQLHFNDVTSKWHFQQMKSYLERIENVRGIEIPLYSNILKIAGTSDCIADFDGELSIIDFKTSRKQKKKEWIKDYFIQACFYSLACVEMYGEFPKKMVICMTTNDNSPCIFVEDVINYKNKLIERKKYYDKKC